MKKNILKLMASVLAFTVLTTSSVKAVDYDTALALQQAATDAYNAALSQQAEQAKAAQDAALAQQQAIADAIAAQQKAAQDAALAQQQAILDQQKAAQDAALAQQQAIADAIAAQQKAAQDAALAQQQAILDQQKAAQDAALAQQQAIADAIAAQQKAAQDAALAQQQAILDQQKAAQEAVIAAQKAAEDAMNEQQKAALRAQQNAMEVSMAIQQASLTTPQLDVVCDTNCSEKNAQLYAMFMPDFVLVDISEQRAIFYRNGVRILSDNCVTGNAKKGLDTTVGQHQIVFKDMNRTLHGSYGEAFVKYWMRFTAGGQGLHDAGWRNNFSPSVYVSNGSHGCVNLKRATAQTIYENSYIGMPVIVEN